MTQEPVNPGSEPVFEAITPVVATPPHAELAMPGSEAHDSSTAPGLPSAGKQPSWGYRDLAIVIGFFFASFVVVMLVFAGAISVLPQLKKNVIGLSLAAQLVLYAMAYLSMHFTLGRYAKPVLPALGWRVPRVGQFTPATVLMIAAIGGLILPFVVNLAVVPFHPPKVPSPFEKFTATPALMVCLAVIATILGPIIEELVFRGFLQPLLSRDLGIAAGILITSLVFGGLHAPEYSYAWQYVGAVTLAGVAFGVMRVWADSTIASSVMHGCFNMLMVMAMFATQGKRL